MLKRFDPISSARSQLSLSEGQNHSLDMDVDYQCIITFMCHHIAKSYVMPVVRLFQVHS